MLLLKGSLSHFLSGLSSESELLEPSCEWSWWLVWHYQEIFPNLSRDHKNEEYSSGMSQLRLANYFLFVPPTKNGDMTGVVVVEDYSLKEKHHLTTDPDELVQSGILAWPTKATEGIQIWERGWKDKSGYPVNQRGNTIKCQYLWVAEKREVCVRECNPYYLSFPNMGKSVTETEGGKV